jgi:hypothetical protein
MFVGEERQHNRADDRKGLSFLPLVQFLDEWSITPSRLFGTPAKQDDG